METSIWEVCALQLISVRPVRQPHMQSRAGEAARLTGPVSCGTSLLIQQQAMIRRSTLVRLHREPGVGETGRANQTKYTFEPPVESAVSSSGYCWKFSGRCSLIA